MQAETSPNGSGDPGFGRCFSDHMAIASYDLAHGWSTTEIVGFAAMSFSPATMVFHYGQAVFEGLKAFRQPDGSISMFRPDDHARRFNRSAQRLAMPAQAPGVFKAACCELVSIDQEWVPAELGHSLYLRPMMIASEVGLGARPANEYRFVVIASPVGSYYARGVEPITVWASPDYVRAAPGGTGSAKCAGNYAGSMAAKIQASAQGCDETLWLDAGEHRWVEELGGMNIVFVIDGPDGTSLVAPPIQDTILDGITRKSLLELGRRLGYQVIERPVSIDEACRAGSFQEVFACGTAAIVAPIGAIRTPSRESVIGDGQAGPVTMRLRDALLALQDGRADDPFGWRVKVTEAEPSVRRCPVPAPSCAGTSVAERDPTSV